MDRTALTATALAFLVAGVGTYLLAITGALWESTPPGDVGLVGFSGILTLLGLTALLLRKRDTPAA